MDCGLYEIFMQNYFFNYIIRQKSPLIGKNDWYHNYRSRKCNVLTSCILFKMRFRISNSSLKLVTIDAFVEFTAGKKIV